MPDIDIGSSLVRDKPSCAHFTISVSGKSFFYGNTAEKVSAAGAGACRTGVSGPALRKVARGYADNVY